MGVLERFDAAYNPPMPMRGRWGVLYNQHPPVNRLVAVFV